MAGRLCRAILAPAPAGYLPTAAALLGRGRAPRARALTMPIKAARIMEQFSNGSAAPQECPVLES